MGKNEEKIFIEFLDSIIDANEIKSLLKEERFKDTKETEEGDVKIIYDFYLIVNYLNGEKFEINYENKREIRDEHYEKVRKLAINL